jgi:hypothetical protein
MGEAVIERRSQLGTDASDSQVGAWLRDLGERWQRGFWREEVLLEHVEGLSRVEAEHQAMAAIQTDIDEAAAVLELDGERDRATAELVAKEGGS